MIFKQKQINVYMEYHRWKKFTTIVTQPKVQEGNCHYPGTCCVLRELYKCYKIEIQQLRDCPPELFIDDKMQY